MYSFNLLWKWDVYICESENGCVYGGPDKTNIRRNMDPDSGWRRSGTNCDGWQGDILHFTFTDGVLLCFVPSYNFCWATEGCFRCISPHELCVWAHGKTLNYSFGSAAGSSVATLAQKASRGNTHHKQCFHQHGQTWCTILYAFLST